VLTNEITVLTTEIMVLRTEIAALTTEIVFRARRLNHPHSQPL